jgi:hypothetical protein
MMEEEAKDFKNNSKNDHEPKDQTEKTIVGTDPSARAVGDNGDTSSGDKEEINIEEVSEEMNF